MPRFVVLYHECPSGHPRPSHWDLMLEAEGALRTWALEHAPDEYNEQVAERLADHRLDYLDYEGPISGDRGHVTRWDAGEFLRLADEPTRNIVELTGKRLRGIVTLERDASAAQRWRFSLSAPSR